MNLLIFAMAVGVILNVTVGVIAGRKANEQSKRLD